MPDHNYDIVALVSNDLVTDRRMHRCLASLTEAGYRCLLLGRTRPQSEPLDEALPFAQERHRLSYHHGKVFYWQLNRAHYRRLLELKPRAVLVVDLDTMWAGARAAEKLDVPWVYDAHELFVEVPEVARRPWIKRAWNWLANRYVTHASACATVGEEIANEHQRRYGRPFQVVRNFPRRSGQAATSGKKNSRTTILYQGALNEGRGLPELIAAASVRKDLDFWIVGDGDLRRQLERQVSDMQLQNVRFFGQVQPTALADLTARAHLGYALMERRSLNYYLSLSNKSIDYLHAGLPSLQMKWPEYARLQAQFGCYHLVETLDHSAVVSAIEAALEPHRYEFMQVGCKAAALELTWELESRRLLELWDEVLTPRS